jgi:hypothetical protein
MWAWFLLSRASSRLLTGNSHRKCLSSWTKCSKTLARITAKTLEKILLMNSRTQLEAACPLQLTKQSIIQSKFKHRWQHLSSLLQLTTRQSNFRHLLCLHLKSPLLLLLSLNRPGRRLGRTWENQRQGNSERLLLLVQQPLVLGLNYHKQ